MTELSPETKALLASAELPPMSAERRAQLKRAVIGGIAAGGAAATTTSLMTKTSLLAKTGGGLTLAAKVALITAAVGVATGAVVSWNRAYQAPAAVNAIPHATGNRTAPTAAPAPPMNAAARTPLDLPPVESAPSARVPVSSPPPVVPAEDSLRGRSVQSKRAVLSVPARRDATASAEASAIDSAIAPSSADETPAASVRVSATSPPQAPALTLTIEEEARLLHDAHRALETGNFAGALAILDAHAARFPRSALEPERSSERVLALCRAGRIADARAASQRFLAVPRPPHLALKVRSSCAESDK